MTETTNTAPEVQVPLGERTPFDKMVPLGAIDSSKPKPILLNVESGVKDVISAIAKNQKIEGTDIDPELFEKLPNSQTGVVMHFIVKGLKEDFNIAFDAAPTSLKVRGTGKAGKKEVVGKSRLLTRDQKNHILAKMEMSFYEKDIMAGKIGIEEAMTSIKAAFEEKREFEERGYMLPAGKTSYPYWSEEAVAEG